MNEANAVWLNLHAWLVQVPALVRSLDPALVALLAAAPILSILYASPMALAITLLLGLGGLAALGAYPGEAYRWSVAGLAFASGLLVVAQAARLRRQRLRSDAMEEETRAARAELAELREKYDSEVYWRQAGERVAERHSGTALRT